MAPAPRASSFFSVLILVLLFVLSVDRAAATGVFQVRRKFPPHGGGDVAEHLAALRRHDVGRHGRLLGAVDLPLGGLGLPTATGLYYTQIEIGSPPKGYYVQVDTGSDILWVNCIRCDGCPTRSGLGVMLSIPQHLIPSMIFFFFFFWNGGGDWIACLLAGDDFFVKNQSSFPACSWVWLWIELTQYDPAGSGTTVGCDQEFCVANSQAACPTTSSPCEFRITYGDGSSTTGFYVSDSVQYNQVYGNGQTTLSNASITFGCGAQLAGDLGSSSQALDGILGFGQADSSMLSQLAAARKVRKIFAHCLDTVRGGGIFAIGNVVQPKVKTTPLVRNVTHYNVNLQGISVGDATLQLPTSTFQSGDSKGTIIDSGTTLAYLPREVYKTLLTAVFDKYQDLPLHTNQDFICFQFSESIDDGFPVITFSFEGGLTLNVYPHDYLFQNGNDLYCMGFLDGGVQTKDGKDMVLLGDLVLSNKLVVYDLEKQVIGWTDYNCSSSIKIEDDKTGSVYTVDAQNISAGWRFQWHKSLILLLVTTIWSCLML